MNKNRLIIIVGIVVASLAIAGRLFMIYVEKNTSQEMTLSGNVYVAPSPTPYRPKASQDPMAGISLGRQNAIKKAQSYLSHSAFSRKGLVDQLRFEGYTDDEAVFACDYLEPDWYAEAAEKAASYMSHMSFSKQGLYDQLIFEGFTEDEALYGVTSVGY